MQNIDRIASLIQKYLRGEINSDEGKELNHWVAQNNFNRQVFDELTEEISLTSELAPLSETDFDRIWNKIADQTKVVTMEPKRKLQWKYIAAASVLIFILIGGYFWYNSNNQKEVPQAQISTNPYKNDIPPGTDKAILTLSDGSTIQLNNSGNRKIADQNGTTINQQEAHLVYETTQSTSINQSTLSYNILSTPRGGQYQVVLPDGSKVWLNAVSSIRYPVAFMGNERKVEITGEAYFSIRHNEKMPFRVVANGTEIHDLGTEFNVNAYSDEIVLKTTLINGSVKVVNENRSQLLAPGQQGQVSKDGKMKIETNVDMAEVTAWKNGQFKFINADIQTIMRQVARWYDVDMVYERPVNEKFYADLSRNTNVSTLLKMLETTKAVHFKIEGKKVIVIP